MNKQEVEFPKSVAMASLAVVGCLSSCSPTSTPVPAETSSISGAQMAFYPERYQHGVADLVLSLPIGFYESAPRRLTFARQILETGSPRPAENQETYLRVEADGLAPTRHFLRLDQTHLLVYSEEIIRMPGYPARLEVLERFDDARWRELPLRGLPSWASSPAEVRFDPDAVGFTLVGQQPGEKGTFRWARNRFVSGEPQG